MIIGFGCFGEGEESAGQKCLRDEVILTSNQKNLDSSDLSTEPAREFDTICEEHKKKGMSLKCALRNLKTAFPLCGTGCSF